VARMVEEGAARAKNPWCDRRPEGAGGGALSRLLHGCGARSSGARGHSAVVGVQLRGHSAVVGANCGIVRGATVVIVVAGNIGLVIGLQKLQMGCCCVWFVDGENACHGCGLSPSC
jgi:hypothetical protein